jgi:hypothetical protein
MSYVRAVIFLVVAVMIAAEARAIAPPAEDNEPPEVIELFNEVDARSQALRDQFAVDDETCSNEVRSAPLVIPVTRHDRLVGYAFVTPRFCLARGVNRFQFDDRMHFIVDQMIRAAHRTPFTLDEDAALTETETNAALLSAAVAIIGDDRVERLDLMGSDVRLLQ